MASQRSFIVKESRVVETVEKTFRPDSMTFMSSKQKQTHFYEVVKMGSTKYPMVKFVHFLKYFLHTNGGQIYDIIYELIRKGSDFHKIGALLYVHAAFKNCHCGFVHKIPILFSQFESLRLLASTVGIDDVRVALIYLTVTRAFNITPDECYGNNTVVVMQNGVYSVRFLNDVNPYPITFAVGKNSPYHFVSTHKKSNK